MQVKPNASSKTAATIRLASKKMDAICRMDSEREALKKYYANCEHIWNDLAIDEACAATSYALAFDVEAKSMANHLKRAEDINQYVKKLEGR